MAGGVGPITATLVWLLAVIALAPLPMAWQRRLGLPLLMAFPVLLVWLARAHGILPVLLLFAAALSLFRKPLAHLWGKITTRADVN